MYAPTGTASPATRTAFYDQLQRTVTEVPDTDMLLVVGDFNARVGKTHRGDWHGVVGEHGTGVRNENGEALLTFCAVTGLLITNTCFRKAPQFRNTWRNPRTKAWHCIDYILTRQAHRRLCQDTSVVPSAECWTDHRMLATRLQLQWAQTPRARRRPKRLHLQLQHLRERERVTVDGKTSYVFPYRTQLCTSFETLRAARAGAVGEGEGAAGGVANGAVADVETYWGALRDDLLKAGK